MRKGFISISLLTTVMVAFTSVAFSYYNEAKKTVTKEACCKAPKTDETIWEMLTKKMVGMVNLSY